MAETTVLARTDDKRPYNNLLRVLREADYALIAPHLSATEHSVNDVIYNPGDSVEVVHFPCGAAMVSFLISGEDGRDVETVLIGREGAVGGIVSHGRLPAYSRIIVKFGGQFACLNVADLEAAKARSPALRNFFARYADCLLAQIFQSTACNAIHAIEQRAAKWMLAATERTGDDVVPFTHEELAAMLGAGRSHTTRVLQEFRSRGLIETRRGSVLVRDPAALKKVACNCNELVKAHFDDVLAGVYPNGGN
jgi:DNA-binding transcriptional regulator YhcF (GntR family)